MAFVFDHAFVFVEPGGAEADALAAAGLSEGPPNVHPGQGTRNRRFFFRNGMLELLWVHCEAEAGSAGVARTRLLERSRYKSNGACPFGVALARTDAETGNPPLATWPYAPPYLPEGATIAVSERSESPQKPFVFVMPDANREPRRHSLVEVRNVDIQYPAWEHCDFGDRLGTDSRVFLSYAEQPLMSVTLDREAAGGSIDLRPHTPLLVQW